MCIYIHDILHIHTMVIHKYVIFVYVMHTYPLHKWRGTCVAHLTPETSAGVQPSIGYIYADEMLCDWMGLPIQIYRQVLPILPEPLWRLRRAKLEGGTCAASTLDLPQAWCVIICMYQFSHMIFEVASKWPHLHFARWKLVGAKS